MTRMDTIKRLAAAALALVLLLGLAACGGAAQEAKGDEGADSLQGIYAALTGPDSEYSQNKSLYKEYYPEAEFTEALEADRITIAVLANGSEYLSDGSWDFVKDGDRLKVTVQDGDYWGAIEVTMMADAVARTFGMDPDLVVGYVNGLSMMETESENFRITENADGSSTYSLNIAGAWDMKELDQMVLDEKILDEEPLGESYLSQSASLGKMRMLANGNVNGYTVLFAEYGELDQVAFRSITNVVTLRKPAGWEQFLEEFTELKAIEGEAYSLDLDPSDETIAEIMGEKNEKFRYALLRFGTEEPAEQDVDIRLPDGATFAETYLRPVAELERGTAGSSLVLAQVTASVLRDAYDNELWLADSEELRAKLQEGWESLSDEERARFEENFPSLQDLAERFFENYEEERGRFEDAGAAETVEGLLEDDTAQWSWESLRDATLTLLDEG